MEKHWLCRKKGKSGGCQSPGKGNSILRHELAQEPRSEGEWLNVTALGTGSGWQEASGLLSCVSPTYTFRHQGASTEQMRTGEAGPHGHGGEREPLCVTRRAGRAARTVSEYQSRQRATGNVKHFESNDLPMGFGLSVHCSQLQGIETQPTEALKLRELIFSQTEVWRLGEISFRTSARMQVLGRGLCPPVGVPH